MISTVCLNPAVDQNAEVDRLQIGGMNRLKNLQAFAAGKGVNVAVVLKRLRAEVRCFGLIGDADELYFRQSMQQEGVPFFPVTALGSVRRNLKVAEADSRTVTEFNQQGVTTDPDAIERFEALLAAQSATDGYVALCGSLPPGCAPETYGNIMNMLPDRRWVVDASGDALRQALKAKPFLVKPNQAELEEIAGTRLKDIPTVKDAAQKLCKGGVRYAAVSLGQQGALITDGERTVFAAAVPVKTSFTVGAGDAFLAGILYGLSRGETMFDSLRYGIAAGAACVEGGGIRGFSRQRFDALLSGAKTRDL
jgi:1-phosphofructokinase